MKGNYTQEELLLLSNFVYIPACVSDEPIGAIIDRYRAEDGTFTEESVIEAARGGGMSCRDVKTVFTHMDRHIEKRPEFGELSASRRLEERNVRAVCYTDPEDEDPVVVFRGTGGTKDAWRDNFEGAFSEDTKIQRVADDFVRFECGVYDDIVVTGHSKGGNLAQYVTVKENNRILECISYDGQGFGNDLIANNKDAVNTASAKITSISAYNDFVNILLTGIAGTCLFVANGPSAAEAHSSVSLLTENTFDENGDFTSLRSQGVVSSALGHVTGLMCDLLEGASHKDKETMSDITGSAISLALTSPPDEISEECIAPTLGRITAEFVKKTVSKNAPLWDRKFMAYGTSYIETDACMLASKRLFEHITDIDMIGIRVNELRMNIAYSITAKLCAEKALQAAYEDIMTVKERILKIAQMSLAASERYKRADDEAAALMNL